MAKVKISEFDVNPDNNTDINNINIAEGCAPSGINNAIRQLMSDLKAFQTGADGDPFNGAVNGTVGATTPNTGAFTSLSASGAFSANGGATLGDASGDALTINSSAVSIPNGLNFDSNTFVIDATNNRVGVGTASPSQRLHVASAGTVAIQAENTASSGSAYLNAKNTATTCAFGVDASGGYIETAGAYNTIFYTNSAERMRIDSSGNVGIGTSSPTTKLDVVGTAAGAYINSTGQGTSSLFLAGNSGSASVTQFGGELRFNTNGTANTAGTGVSERMRIDSSGNLLVGTTSSSSARLAIDSGTAGLMTTFNSTNANGGYLVLASSGTVYGDIGTSAQVVGGSASDLGINARGSRNFVFGTNNTERMRITSDGFLNIGRTGTSGNARLSIAGNSNTNNGINFSYTGVGEGCIRVVSTNALTFGYDGADGGTERMRIDSSGNLLIATTSLTPTSGGMALAAAGYIRTSRGTTTTAGHHEFANPNGVVGSIQTTNSTTAYNTSSDYRLKENIAPMTGALAKVSALKPVTYKWKSDGSDGQGFIAHELQAVVPDCVTGEKDAVDSDGKPVYQGIDTSFLVATLTAAIQEQQTIINDLKARIETLESK